MNDAFPGAPALMTEELEQVEFLRQFDCDPALRADPHSRARYAALTSRASVCSYCGVGCPYTVETTHTGSIASRSPARALRQGQDLAADRRRRRTA